MSREPSHIKSPYTVWCVTGKRIDNGNGLYYRVWAGNIELAKQYLKRHDLKDVEVEFTEITPLVNGTYSQTVNCFNNHPEQYDYT
jgi:hypothetical protein